MHNRYKVGARSEDIAEYELLLAERLRKRIPEDETEKRISDLYKTLFKDAGDGDNHSLAAAKAVETVL